MKTPHLVLIALLVATFSGVAHADKGSCEGKASDGKQVTIDYFTNGYTDDNTDFYAKVTLGSESAEYGYSITGDGEGSWAGEATSASKKEGKDFGPSKVLLSADSKSMSGSVGKVTFENLTCSYEPG